MSTPETTKMDFFELGDKTSLVSGEMAIERVRYTPYDVIIIQETFAGSSLRSNALLNYLAPLPMAQRRYSFVCLIGPSFKTLDAMQAFAQSVHVVVNPTDLPNLAAILKKGLAEFDLLYKVYKDVVASQSER
jgi:hypothetical protein